MAAISTIALAATTVAAVGGAVQARKQAKE